MREVSLDLLFPYEEMLKMRLIDTAFQLDDIPIALLFFNPKVMLQMEGYASRSVMEGSNKFPLHYNRSISTPRRGKIAELGMPVKGAQTPSRRSSRAIYTPPV